MQIIFDLDGTLADTAILTMTAFREVAPAMGLAVPSLKAVRDAIGYANPEFYHRIYPDGPFDLVRRTGEEVEQAELRLMPVLGRDLLFSGCRELLDALRKLQIPLFIASTGSEEHVGAVTKATGIHKYFSGIFCGEPDKAAMIGRIIGGQSKRDFIMVGDKQKDCDGAHANGIRAIGACYGYCVRGEADFDEYIDDPLELLKLL